MFGIVPVIFYLLFLKRINDKKLRVIILLLLIGFVVDLSSIYLKYKSMDNFQVFNWFLLIETLLLYYFFFTILSTTLSNVVIILFTVVFSIIWLKLFIKVGAIGFIDFGVTVENISVIILSILFFYEQINKPESFLFYNQPRFWVVAAYLVYSAGTFFLFLYIDSLHRNDQQKYYVLNYVFIILKSILLSIAMFMKNDQDMRKKFQIT